MPQATQAAFDARVDVDDAIARPEPRAAPPRRRHPARNPRRSRRDRAGLARLRAASPTARCSRPSTGSRPGSARSARARRAADRRDRPRRGRAICCFCCRSPSRRAGFARRLTWLGSDLCDYNAPLLAPDFARGSTPRAFTQLWREIVRAAAKPSAAALRPHRSRQDAARRSARSPIRSSRSASCVASQRRLSDAGSAATGRPSTPRSARRRRAGATAPSASSSPISARSSSSTRRTRGDLASTLDTLMRAEVAVVRRDGRRQHLRAAGLSRVLSRAVRPTRHAASSMSAGSTSAPTRRRSISA